MRDRLKKVTTKGWIAAGCWSALYIAFIVWLAWDDAKSLWWLLILPVIVDAFTTKFINWSWWKKYKPGEGETPNKTLYTICSWVDAIVFALVAVYFINLYMFQNYQIPSSSLEKSLRVGDFLFVSKMSYGARVPNTPLSMPLMQHSWPAVFGGGKSYIDKPQWPYKRLRGWDTPKKGDIVVFNFPAGDTVCLKMQNPDYYTLCHYYGENVVKTRKDVFGDIVVRPVDRRENYVKRCVGEPGDTLQLINNVVWVNGEREPERAGIQFNYIVRTDGHLLTRTYLDKLGISHDDQHLLAYLLGQNIDHRIQAYADGGHGRSQNECPGILYAHELGLIECKTCLEKCECKEIDHIGIYKPAELSVRKSLDERTERFGLAGLGINIIALIDIERG